MSNWLLEQIAALVAPLAFSTPLRRERLFMRFAAAEHASMLDLLEAARGTDSPLRAALYLRHAEDEARHARVFVRLARRQRANPYLRLTVDTERLFDSLGEVDFLAFVALGETRGRIQFTVYERYFRTRGQTLVASAFGAILTDERRHEHYTHAELVRLAGEGSGARLRAMRFRRLGTTYRHWARSIAQQLYAVAIFPLQCAGAVAVRRMSARAQR